MSNPKQIGNPLNSQPVFEVLKKQEDGRSELVGFTVGITHNQKDSDQRLFYRTDIQGNSETSSHPDDRRYMWQEGYELGDMVNTQLQKVADRYDQIKEDQVRKRTSGEERYRKWRKDRGATMQDLTTAKFFGHKIAMDAIELKYNRNFEDVEVAGDDLFRTELTQIEKTGDLARAFNLIRAIRYYYSDEGWKFRVKYEGTSIFKIEKFLLESAVGILSREDFQWIIERCNEAQDALKIETGKIGGPDDNQELRDRISALSEVYYQRLQELSNYEKTNFNNNYAVFVAELNVLGEQISSELFSSLKKVVSYLLKINPRDRFEILTQMFDRNRHDPETCEFRRSQINKKLVATFTSQNPQRLSASDVNELSKLLGLDKRWDRVDKK